MNDEVDIRRESLNKVAFGIAAMFGIYWIYSIFIADKLSISSGFKPITGYVLLYAIGLEVFLFIARKTDEQAYAKSKFPPKRF